MAVGQGRNVYNPDLDLLPSVTGPRGLAGLQLGAKRALKISPAHKVSC